MTNSESFGERLRLEALQQQSAADEARIQKERERVFGPNRRLGIDTMVKAVIASEIRSLAKETAETLMSVGNKPTNHIYSRVKRKGLFGRTVYDPRDRRGWIVHKEYEMVRGYDRDLGDTDTMLHHGILLSEDGVLHKIDKLGNNFYEYESFSSSGICDDDYLVFINRYSTPQSDLNQQIIEEWEERFTQIIHSK